MASVVSIQIRVDNGQALPSIDQLNQALGSVGVKGTASFKQASDGADKMKGHVSTGLDSVRLLSQEFGLRLPRAIEAMLSRMPGITSALSSVLGVMAGIVALQVFMHVGEEIYDAYQKYVSLNAAADKYYETQKKTREEGFGNPRDLETAQARLGLASNQALLQRQDADSLRAKSLFDLNPVSAVGDFLHARTLADNAATSMGQRDQTSNTQASLRHQQLLDQIELNHASDAQLVGQQKINAEAQKKIAIDAENRRSLVDEGRRSGSEVSPTAGIQEQALKDEIAIKEASAQNTLAGRESALAIMKANDAATQGALTGEALRYQKMIDDTREITVELQNQGKAAEIPSRIREINAKYFADTLLQTQKLQEEARQTHRSTTLDGLEGVPRIRQEETNSVSDINDQEQKLSGGKTLPYDVQASFSSKRADAHLAATQKIQAIDDAYADHSKALQASMEANQVQGFARIEAERQKQRLEENKGFEKQYGTDPSQISEGAQHNHQTNLASIDQDAAERSRLLSQQNAAADLQSTQQAAEAERRVRANGIMGWVNSYKDGITEIQAQEAARLAKLQEDVNKEGLTQQEASQRKMDIEREANANIAEQNQQLQEKIAGDLQQAFTNPVDFIKSQMEKMMFEIIAGWIVRMNVFKGLFGQTMGGLTPGAPTGATGAGGFAGTLAGTIPGMRGIVNGSPNISSVYSNAAPSTVSSGGGFGAGSAISTVAHAIPGMHGAPSGSTSTAGGGFGASSGTAAQASAVSAAPSGLAAPRIGVASAGGFGGILGDVNSATGTLSQAIPGMRGIVNGTVAASDTGLSIGTSSSTDDPYTAGISDAQAQAAINTGTIAPNGGSSSALQQGLGIAGTVGTAGYSAEQTTVKAFETGNPLQGALGDAAAGAAIGSVIPGIGTAIGAGIGAAVGASAGLIGMVSGEAGNLGARSYYEKTILPSLNSASLNPGGDYQAAVSDISKIASDGMAYMTTKFGATSANWVKSNYLTKETDLLLQKVEDTAAGGRQYVTMSAAQFHAGGTIAGFGDLATSSNEGFIHAMMNETVMNPAASMTHAPMLAAANSGASHSDIASMYLAGSKSPSSSSQSGDTNHNYTIHAMDSKSFDSYLKNGAARQINKHLNTYNSQYSGDGISG